MSIYQPHTASRRIGIIGDEVTIGTTIGTLFTISDLDNNVCEVIDTERLENYVLTITNTGATNSLDGILLEYAATADGPWEDRALGIFGTISPGASESLENLSNLRRFFRLRGVSAAGTTTCIAIIQGQAHDN